MVAVIAVASRQLASARLPLTDYPVEDAPSRRLRRPGSRHGRHHWAQPERAAAIAIVSACRLAIGGGPSAGRVWEESGTAPARRGWERTPIGGWDGRTGRAGRSAD